MRKELKQLAARIEGLERAGRADEPPASAEAA
jgi:BMFP domain-containing protein YqiC